MAATASSSRRPYWLQRIVVARAALARGPLIPDGRAWRFGRRRFSHVTVAKLIAAGEAAIDPRTRTLAAVAPATNQEQMT